MKAFLEGISSLDESPHTPLAIESFSAGFNNNGLASQVSSSALAIAAGVSVPTIKQAPANPTATALPDPARQVDKEMLHNDSGSEVPCPTCGRQLEIYFKDEAFCSGCGKGRPSSPNFHHHDIVQRVLSSS